MTHRELYGGLIHLHLLHHAAARPIYGFSMIEELAGRGYRLSPGTLYPILHGLEKKGYLRSNERRLGPRLGACTRLRRAADAHSRMQKPRCASSSVRCSRAAAAPKPLEFSLFRDTLLEAPKAIKSA